MFCKNCGKELSDDSDFCPYCGGAKNAVDSNAKTTAVVSDAPHDGRESLAAFKELIGANTDYYLREFEKLNRGEKSKFNWAVFLGGPIVPLYRKCFDFFKRRYLAYWITFCFFFFIEKIFMPSVYDLRIHLLLSLIQLGVSIWGIVIFITSAKRFNAYYYQKLQQALEQPNPAECKESCGTTHLYYLLLIGLYIAYVFLVSGLGNALH